MNIVLNQNLSIEVFAPATVANVASGFDVLGFAIEKPGDTVKLVKKMEKSVDILSIYGDAGQLPTDPDKNTASVAVQAYLDSIDNPFGVDIVLHKGMPLQSGLGSSAASSVAAVFAVNLLADAPLPRGALLPFTLRAEEIACGSAHADNVASSLLGGFVLIRSYNPLDYINLPTPSGISCAVAHPHTEVNTRDARRLLKKEIKLADAISQWGNLAALVAALYEENFDLLARSLKDVVAEPIRSLLIPGFNEVKTEALQAGALGCSIAGSGPSMFALCRSFSDARVVGQRMKEKFIAIGLKCDLYVSRINQEGPQLISRSNCVSSEETQVDMSKC